MDMKTYSPLAHSTAADLGQIGNINHALLGLVSEVGEIADNVKRNLAYGKPLDMLNLKEEAGDLCWYMNLLLLSIGSSWEEVTAMNIAKLEARYPGLRFTAERAVNRDKGAEVQAMQNAQAR